MLESSTFLQLRSPSGLKNDRLVECLEMVTQLEHSIPRATTNSPSLAFKMLRSNSLGWFRAYAVACVAKVHTNSKVSSGPQNNFDYRGLFTEQLYIA